MGKPTGFLEYDRQEPGYRSVEERVKDYKEVEVRLSEQELNDQAARCMDCGVPFCHAAGCAIANVIPEINDMVYRDRWEEALTLLLSMDDFPEFTSRICPALCEPACVAGLVGEAVTIRQIERAVIERGFEEGWVKPFIPEIRTGKQVAVVGSGPTGLTAAEQLNRAGHTVTVYEQAQKVGGLLRYGIPDFKLDKMVIDRRVALMQESGIIFEIGVKVGDDISASYLLKKFDALCLAGGARQPRDLSVPGRELAGVHYAMDFLVQQNQRNGSEPVTGPELMATDKTVVVIGGGDTGSDCVGTSIRQGATKVYQFEIMPQPPEERSEITPWPAWPLMLRTSSSHKEGCERRWSVTTTSFTGKDGVVTGLECAEVAWEASEKGARPIPVTIPGSAFTIKADMILLAMGFTGPEKGALLENLKVVLDERGNVKGDAAYQTSVPGVFAAGDIKTGPSLVVRCLNQGREMAAGVHAYLTKK